MGKFKLPDLNKRLDSQETMCVTPGGRGVLHQIFGTRVQHTKKKWTQSDLNFSKNEGSKNLKLMEKGVNWIENEGKIDTKCFKSVK